MSRYSSRARGGRRAVWIASAAAAAALVCGLLVAANPGASSAGGLECAAQKTDQVAFIGVSSSGRDAHILSDRRAEVRHLLGLAAYCNTKLIVRAWSTAGAVRTLWSADEQLTVPGQTDAGRRRRVDGVVDDAMHTFDSRLQLALDQLPATGSDFLAWPDLAADARYELADKRAIAVTVLDDGVQSANPNLNQPLTVATATQLADKHKPTADLHGVTVTIDGVGQIAGTPPPAGGDWVPALRAFTLRTCQATRATCAVLAAATTATS